MKNKGFTLIELLAIIIILGIIATIAGVAVTKSVKNTEGKASDIQVKNIKTAAKTWASANPYILPEVGKTLTISLNTLIAGGYIGNNGGDISNNANIVMSNYTKSNWILLAHTFSCPFGLDNAITKS